MLDLLCDTMALDDYKDAKKREVKEMTKIMEQRKKLRD
jgi:hypothetical protein